MSLLASVVGPEIEREGIAYASLSDFHGSVIDLGSDHFSYTAFGDDNTKSPNPWCFHGSGMTPTCPSTSLKRNYSPTLGRWLTPIP